jgi:hypothetical protein
MKTFEVSGNKGSSNPAKNCSNPLVLETLASVVERDDGMFAIGRHDDAGAFPTRQFAHDVAVYRCERSVLP